MRIGLVGSHGVGKSTLVGKLLKALPNYTTVEEHSRKVLKGGNGLNFKTTNTTQQAFYDSYIEMFKNVKEKNLITPRTVIDLLAYSRYFYKHDYKINPCLLVDMEYLVFHNRDWIDLYCYIPIRFKQFEENVYREGQVSAPEYQKEIDDNIKEIFDEFDIPYIVVTGEFDERVNSILSRVKNG